ncbi:MAG: hypothetical protein CL609_03595 [Anaerolineaceae bacterium]|nr:hypothetical protein [Anaerolineaceae bacterium]
MEDFDGKIKKTNLVQHFFALQTPLFLLGIGLAFGCKVKPQLANRLLKVQTMPNLLFLIFVPPLVGGMGRPLVRCALF